MTLLESISQYKWVFLFYSFVVLLIYLNKKRFEKQAPFIFLYKTKFGLKIMDVIGSRLRGVLKIIGYIGVGFAYLGFFFITYILLQNAFDLIIDKPGAVGGSPVIPGLPIAGLGITFPLVIGWISLFIIIIVHEFSHGIIARVYNLKIKSSGIAFFGPLLGAFVEIDEEELAKQPHRVQQSVFAAGPFSNIILWFVCSLLLLSLYPSKGVLIQPMENMPALKAGITNSTLLAINSVPVKTIDDLSKTLDNYKPGEEITATTDKGEYKLILTKHPDNPEKGYMGISIRGEDRSFILPIEENSLAEKIVNWFVELIVWVSFISINIGLINLFPFFITDGARMLKLNLQSIFNKKADKIWLNINIAALFVIIILIFMPLFRELFYFVISVISTSI